LIIADLNSHVCVFFYDSAIGISICHA